MLCGTWPHTYADTLCLFFTTVAVVCNQLGTRSGLELMRLHVSHEAGRFPSTSLQNLEELTALCGHVLPHSPAEGMGANVRDTTKTSKVLQLPQEVSI